MSDITSKYAKGLKALAESLPYTRFDETGLTIGLVELCHVSDISLMWPYDGDGIDYTSDDGTHWTENGCDEGRGYSRPVSEGWMVDYLNSDPTPFSDDTTLNLLIGTAKFCGLRINWVERLDWPGER